MKRTCIIALVVGVVSSTGLTAAYPALPTGAADHPPQLRACCALGYDVDLRFGALQAPVGLQNVVEVGQLGRHRYSGRSIFDEHNGLVYTCRGGVIDVGHLRAAADLFAHVYAKLNAHGDRAGTVEFELEDGPAEITLHRPPTGPAERAVVAQRVAYDLTVWHEIVTATGDRTVPIFSEAFSAFSPEDLYSDLLGTQIGAAAVASPLPYDRAVEEITQRVLRGLGAQSIPRTRQALDQVEGRWWDRQVAVPDQHLLRVRNLSFGPEMRPWQIPDPAAVGCAPEAPYIGRRPQVLPSGVDPDELYALRLTPSAASGIAAPSATPDDFEALVSQAAQTLSEAPPPDPAAETLAGIHVMRFRGFGGVLHDGSLEGVGGIEVIGGQADGPGGDLSIVRFAAAYDTGPRGLIAHFTGIQARNLFFCTEQGGERQHPPIAAWFQSCNPTGFFGVGGTLAQFQHDGGTGRWAMRPIEAHLSFALLENAFSPGFERRQLILQTGLSVENAKRPDEAANFSVRARAQLQGLLRSSDLRWELRLQALLQQDVLDRGDRGAEVGLDVLHRARLRDRAPSGDGPGPVWGVLTVGLQLAYSHWTQPGAALDDVLLPLAPADTPHGARAVLTAGFSFQRWMF